MESPMYDNAVQWLLLELHCSQDLALLHCTPQRLVLVPKQITLDGLSLVDVSNLLFVYHPLK